MNHSKRTVSLEVKHDFIFLSKLLLSSTRRVISGVASQALQVKLGYGSAGFLTSQRKRRRIWHLMNLPIAQRTVTLRIRFVLVQDIPYVGSANFYIYLQRYIITLP